MEIPSCWKVLGIAPTADLKLIRRAYALKLKAIDVEAEPRRFVELRGAYDAARAGSPDDAVPPAPPAEAGADSSLTDRLAREILDLLASPSPTAAIEEALSDLTLRLLAEIDRETVQRQFEAEEWLTSLIAEHIPRSDAMIRPAVAQFGWLTQKYGQYRADKATILIDRLRDLHFAEFLVLREDGRHHLAYLTLQQPPYDGFMERDYEGMAAVERLFREAGDYPNVANVTFDRDVVEEWHHHIRKHDLGLERWKGRGKVTKVEIAMYIFIAFFMAVILLALFSFAAR